MSIITKRELRELDLDWYCLINNRPVHIASMGGKIPEAFTERAVLRTLEDKVVALPSISEVSINSNFIKAETAKGYEYIDKFEISDFVEETFKHIPSFVYNMNWDLVTRIYASTFVDKARKGFYSYARKGETDTYVLVASPETVLDINKVDLGLQSLIEGDGDMPELIEIV